MIRKILKLGLLCGVSLFFIACSSKSSMFVDFDKVIDSKDFKEIVGDEVKFYFGTGSKAKIISYKNSSGSAKIGRYNDYFSNSLSGKSYAFSEIDIACGYALLDNLVALKAYAQKVGGKKVVNIVSYYKKFEQRDSKDSFLCLVGKSKVDVKLKADIAQ